MLFILILHRKDGISLCPPLNLPVPSGQINSGDQTQEDIPQDNFCAGSGNRSTSFVQGQAIKPVLCVASPDFIHEDASPAPQH